jgi:signal transduction histidine kinase
MPRIFEMFDQGEATLDRTSGGLGIGLALVRRLAELHGGDALGRAEPHVSFCTVDTVTSLL